MALENLIQINARGEQERLLYGNPQMTYFKKVYRTSSNFARSYLNIPFSGTADFGRKIHLNLPHNGDLLANLYLSMTLPYIPEKNSSTPPLHSEKGNGFYCNGIGYKIIKSIEIKFNGKQIEYLTGEMICHILNLQYDSIDKDTLAKLFRFREYTNYNISFVNNIANEKELSKLDYERRGPINLDIPIPFFFSNKTENYLPLCAMSNTSIEVIIEIEKVENLIFGNDDNSTSVTEVIDVNNINSINNFKVISEVINLDINEKRLFSINDLTYLIKLNNIIASEKIDGNTSGNINIDLNAKNAVRMIYFSFLPDINERFRDYFNYSINYLSEPYIYNPTSSANGTLTNYYRVINRPLLFMSNNNKIIENLCIEVDNNKLFDAGLLSLNFLNNVNALNKNLNQLKYQLFTYNFNLNDSDYVNGSLNFSRLIKKNISFKIGSDYINYLNNNGNYSFTTGGINWNNVFSNKYHSIIFNCYSNYYNYLIIKDGLAGLKYN